MLVHQSIDAKIRIVARAAITAIAATAVLSGSAYVVAQNRNPVDVPVFEVDPELSHHAGQDAARVASVAPLRILTAMSGCFSARIRSKRAMRPRTVMFRLRRWWSSAQPENTSRAGAVRQRSGEYEWFNRGGLHSAFAECPSCTSERRLNGDGRPGSGEHGIYVDARDNVWLTGNGDGDGQILKFSRDGKFLLQIGKGGSGVDSNSTEHVSRAAGIFVYDKTNEVFVADGYGNRRVVVFDADTGKYKRHWGAYGNRPDDKAPKARQTSGPGSLQFNTPHGIAVSNDGIVYVSDRANNRVQTFKLDGTFIREGFVKRDSHGTGTAFGVALSTDPGQRFLYVADGSNERIAILDRASLTEIGQIGRPGRKAGEFFHLHSLGVDPQGNLITGESQGYRVQKFIFKGVSVAR